MANIKITEYEDQYNCDTCGRSWATGFVIEVDGKPLIDLVPLAHCFGGTSFTRDEALERVLALQFGSTVEWNLEGD